MQEIVLRKATIDDIPTLMQWDTLEHVRSSNPNSSWDWYCDLAEDFPWRTQQLICIGGKPIGFVETLDPYEDIYMYWGSIVRGYRAIDIWIGEREYLSRGYGTKVMTRVINDLFREPDVRAILVDPRTANLRAQKFYNRLGFKILEKRQFGEDDCTVMFLPRAVWESTRRVGEKMMR